MTPKDKKRNEKKSCEGSCFDCKNANYICEGDFLCDLLEQPLLVIENWVPTKNYFSCYGEHYEPV